MKFLLFAVLGLPLIGQPAFPCKGSFLGSTVMRGLYGGKTTVYQVDVVCLNKSMSQSAPINGAMITLALPTVNTIPGKIAGLLLTKTYRNQPGQVLTDTFTTGLGAFGILEAARGAALVGAGPAGWVVAGVMGVIKYVIPFFTRNEPPLDLSNQCDNMGGLIVPGGGTFECTEYVSKQAKGVVMPSVITFDLMSGWAPGPMPPIPPVELRRPQEEDTAAKLHQMHLHWNDQETQ